MKNKIIAIVIAIIIVALSYYLYSTFKTRYIIKDYFKQEKWMQKKNKFSHYKKTGYTNLFFGDSMTENFKFFMSRSDSIVNMGISGDFSEGLLKRIDNVITFQPDNLFIMIGINDIIEKVPLSDIQENYLKIIHQVEVNCPKTKIYIQSTLPTYHLRSMFSSSFEINNKVIELNSFLRKISQDKGICYIDMYADFTNENNELKQELTADGIHLNKKGYSIWASYLKKYIKLNMRKQPLNVVF